MDTINPAARAEALRRADNRCEWVYLNGERCQNELSLHAHHRTYIRSGKEHPSDLTILCPAHHILADELRKLRIGQRADIIADHSRYSIAYRLQWLNGKGKKFSERLARERKRYQSELIWFAYTRSEGLDQASRQQFKRQVIEAVKWFNFREYLCVELSEIKPGWQRRTASKMPESLLDDEIVCSIFFTAETAYTFYAATRWYDGIPTDGGLYLTPPTL